MPILRLAILLLAVNSISSAWAAGSSTESLETQLRSEPAEQLAKQARQQGDPTRGAIVFFQQQLVCTKCHATGTGNSPLGPDLAPATTHPAPADSHFVESLLRPSQVLKKGFETLTIVTVDGRTVTGLLLEERDDVVILRNAAEIGKQISISKTSIEERIADSKSLMPDGLVNLLQSRQQFLDLVRYLLEISEKGPARARQLRAAAALFAPPPLPNYEKNIDHAGMIADLSEQNFARGQEIYSRLCVNCHGNQTQPGSLPTSLRFATGMFKNGSDPYSMYRTLTHGYGLMVAQHWMVPRQKYDVIHYIREAYLKKLNPQQYVAIDKQYLRALPTGTSRGPAPTSLEPWAAMNYGPHLSGTYEVGNDASNFAYKGIAVRLDAGTGGVAHGRNWMLYDHDTLRVSAAWSGSKFIDWNGILFNGRHAVHPHVVGQVDFANSTGPGWANPSNAKFDDPRLRGRDGRPYGPLPRRWAHFNGVYHFGDKTILSYTVGPTTVLEMPGAEQSGSNLAFTRTFNIGPRQTPLLLQAADVPEGKHNRVENGEKSAKAATEFESAKFIIVGAAPADMRTATGKQPINNLFAGIRGHLPGAKLSVADGRLVLHIPAGKTPLRFTLVMAAIENSSTIAELTSSLISDNHSIDLAPLTNGGPPRWPLKLTTQAVAGADEGPFAVDKLTWPQKNPWSCRLRLTGFDFLPDGGQLAACTWDGDVWLVSGIDQVGGQLTWQRIASGLFQPLGLKIVDGQIYVSCRDQIVILRDLNGDGETDFYQNFNNDHQVTEHFHEFAMGLQTDDNGNFYYAKSARHAKTALVPHHGTLLRVSPDGARTEILAKGFRAANGVCLNPDGTFIVTDQEGHWNPKNRINWVKPGEFYGNMWGYHDVVDESDAAMQRPLCWITNSFDRSPAELLWVTGKGWGPLQGSLLNLSYGYGKVYVVPHENVLGQPQGGMCQLPIPQFPTGIMRGRFHPGDGQLYACGMFAWAGTQQGPGGLYRIRYTGRPVYLPIGLHAKQSGLEIEFSGKLDSKSIKPANFSITTWTIKRTAEYGSKHYDERRLAVEDARLSSDGHTVMLNLPNIQPTRCMEIKYSLRTSDGEFFDGVVHNTIHNLAQPR